MEKTKEKMNLKIEQELEKIKKKLEELEEKRMLIAQLTARLASN